MTMNRTLLKNRTFNEIKVRDAASLTRRRHVRRSVRKAGNRGGIAARSRPAFSGIWHLP
jgi:hypothetical protein